MILGENTEGSASIPITNELMKNYGVTAEQLHEAALNNMPELTQGTFKGMNEVMAEMMLPNLIAECGGNREAAEQMLESMMPPEDTMFVLSNEQKLNKRTPGGENGRSGFKPENTKTYHMNR